MDIPEDSHLHRGYLRHRKEVRLFILLVDVNRDPLLEDIRILNEIRQVPDVHCIVVCTKCDKLSQSQIHVSTTRIREAFELSDDLPVPFSSVTQLNKNLLWKIIRDACVRFSSPDMPTQEEDIHMTYNHTMQSNLRQNIHTNLAVQQDITDISKEMKYKTKEQLRQRIRRNLHLYDRDDQPTEEAIERYDLNTLMDMSAELYQIAREKREKLL